jgi:hypothetical protein
LRANPESSRALRPLNSGFAPKKRAPESRRYVGLLDCFAQRAALRADRWLAMTVEICDNPIDE